MTSAEARHANLVHLSHITHVLHIHVRMARYAFMERSLRLAASDLLFVFSKAIVMQGDSSIYVHHIAPDLSSSSVVHTLANLVLSIPR